MQFDAADKAILRHLQRDATISVDELAGRINLSRNACWRRVKLMEEAGVIARRVAVLDPKSVNAALSVLIAIRTSKHTEEWASKFREAISSLPEIVGAYRTAGDIDYILKARVRDVEGYDRLYKKLIARVEMEDVSASFVMEEMKETTELSLEEI